MSNSPIFHCAIYTYLIKHLIKTKCTINHIAYSVIFHHLATLIINSLHNLINGQVSSIIFENTMNNASPVVGNRHLIHLNFPIRPELLKMAHCMGYYLLV